MDSKLDFPLHGSSLFIVKHSGVALDDILNTKFGCVASFHGVDFENEMSFSQKKTPIAPERRFKFKLKSGVKVSVWKGDLTAFPADAVVNAANERLQHYGGLAQALSDAGGPRIQQESDDYIRKNGQLNTGDAVALSAGFLQNKMIIHAVGPDLPGDPNFYDVKKAKPLLETAIKNILCIAEKHHLASVAIPAISSGLFHYPLRECAETIVSAVINYFEYSHGLKHFPKEIFLVNHDEPTVKEIERACRQKSAPHQTRSYSQAAASNTKGPASASPSSFSVQIGTIHLTLKKGKIEEQKTDVIVNTASQCRTLAIGNISKAIFQKAGQEMQREITMAVKKHNIICTKPYNLQCKQVFHTFCPEKWNDGRADQILYESVTECLWTAVTHKHKSIAFPAIGTGALGFSKQESAMIMLKAVADFSQMAQSNLDVYFVIFPSDHETYQAFRGQMMRLQETPSHHNPSPGEKAAAAAEARHRSHDSRAPNPHIVLHGPTEESVREAAKWLSAHLSIPSRSVEIYNNFIQHFIEKDHLQLSKMIEAGVSIEEFLTQGHACIRVDSKSEGDAAIAVLKVEEMLCKIQKQFVAVEKHELQQMSNTEVSIERQMVDLSDRMFSDRKRSFKDLGLEMIKVEKIKNPALNYMFDLKTKQLQSSRTETMFQRIPAQFCEALLNIGFHAEFAPPEDPAYGDGIYFANTPKTAMTMWRKYDDEYLYFVEAGVLTGKSAPGQQGLILPPPVGQDPNILRDSVSGGNNVAVIFSGYQALPRYMYTCKMSD
uniref:Poly (ADP-ribose) polymerase family, member 9 n=1 Tax=Iconisemion striatum TaxID=60296 RepID=A0A1A7WR81_9TELE